MSEPALFCIQCEDQPLQAFADASGATLHFCARCRACFCAGSQVSALLGAELSWDPTRVELSLRALHCPIDGAELTRFAVSPQAGAYRCRSCRGLFVENGALPVLRGEARARSLRAPAPSTVPAPQRSSLPAPGRASVPARAAPARFSVAPQPSTEPLHGARLSFDGPLLALLAQPVALLVAWVFTMSTFGRLLAMAAQIQFHELGHAIPAWLSSRAALPLPFGLTFFREEPGVFTALCVLFLAGLLIYRGYVEQRRAALIAGVLALCAWFALTLWVTKETSRMWMLLGGFVGELVLPVVALVAFHLRFPDRWRWDFFRFLALPIAAGAYVGALRLWLGIADGSAALPMGSFLPGDGSGDFSRLISDYGWSEARIIGVGVGVARLSVALLALAYVATVARAFVRSRADAGRR